MKKVLALQKLAPSIEFDPLGLSSLLSGVCCTGGKEKPS
jgi:hypothetical protein